MQPSTDWLQITVHMMIIIDSLLNADAILHIMFVSNLSFCLYKLGFSLNLENVIGKCFGKFKFLIFVMNSIH